MSGIKRFVRRAISVFRSGRAEADLAREITSHLQLLEDSFRAQGMSAEDARFAAKRAFGGVEQAKEHQREARAFRWMDEWWLDAKLGTRMLIKYPGLTLVGSLGMAVSIAIGACFFTVIYSYVQPTLPIDEGTGVVSIQNWDAESNSRESRSLHDYFIWKQELRSIQEIGAFRTVVHNLVVPGGTAEPVRIAEITASGFHIARVPALLGRTLVDGDERESAPPVVVIGYDVWRTRFSSDPAVVGRTIRLGNVVHTLVGVMPERFAFPVNHRFWVPLRANPALYERRQGPAIDVFARLAPTVSVAAAQAELATVGQHTAETFPKTHAHLRPRIVPYTMLYVFVSGGDIGRWQLHLAQSLVSMLLVIVCVNVAILIYARTATRMGEIAVRTALGASRRRIVAQLFVEALVLSSVAAVIGLGLASFAMEQMYQVLLSAGAIPFWITPGLSLGAEIYVVVLTIVAAVIAGVVPALRATSDRMLAGLRQLGGGTGIRLGATSTGLVAAQVAFAVAILPPVIFQGSEVIPYAATTPGFPAHEFLSARLAMDRETPPTAKVESYEREFTSRYAVRQTELVNRLKATPGVAAVSVAWTEPGGERTAWIEIEGLAAAPTDAVSSYAVGSGKSGYEVRFGRVDPAFFEVFDIPLVAGRRFNSIDMRATTMVVVNRSFVREFLQGGNALGRRLRYVGRSEDATPEDVDMNQWVEIVGVVGDFPPHGMEPGQADAKIYHALGPGRVHPATLAIRLRGTDPTSFAPKLRDITAAVDPTLRADAVLPLDKVLTQGQGMIRVGALAIALLTASVLLLSAAGIYAMMSFTITQRRKEIGIRTALGADPRHILSNVFARASRQLLVGVSVGIVAAVLLDRLAEGDLTGGHAAVVVPSVAVLMVVVGLLATLGPARRCLRIDPTEALKADG